MCVCNVDFNVIKFMGFFPPPFKSIRMCKSCDNCDALTQFLLIKLRPADDATHPGWKLQKDSSSLTKPMGEGPGWYIKLRSPT